MNEPLNIVKEHRVLGDERVVAVVLAAVVTAAFLVAGPGWLAHAPLWPVRLVAAPELSLSSTCGTV